MNSSTWINFRGQEPDPDNSLTFMNSANAMTQPTSQNSDFCGRTRREFLWETGAGFTGLALSGLLDDDFLSNQAVAADGKTKFVNPLAPRDPHFDPKATSVIFLYMYGGPSHIDTFDYKPKMEGMTARRSM